MDVSRFTQLEAYLAPVQDGDPCGPDLEYDAEFLSLIEAARGKAEQQFGDTIIPAQEPEWRDLEERGLALLRRTKDVRVAIPVLRAQTRLHQLDGLARGLWLVLELMKRYWEPLHPRLEIDGEADPGFRMNAVAQLGEFEGLLKDVRQAGVLEGPGGRVTVRDLEILSGRNAAGAASAFTDDQVRGMLSDRYLKGEAPLAAAQAALACLEEIQTLLSERVETMALPDLEGLRALLRVCVRFVPKSHAPEVAEGEAATGSDGAGAPAAGRTPVGDIRSREDALRALERVCEYLEQNEPTNPAPLLIRRAQRLMNLNFVDILRELAPDSVGHIENIVGAARDQ